MTAPTPDEESTETEQLSMLELATFLLRHRRLIAGCAGVLFLVVVLLLSFGDPQYTSASSFVPQSSGQASALAGVAAQLGVQPSGTNATQSPAFYADLLTSRDVLTTILRGEYRFPTDTGMSSGKLIDLLGVKAGSEELRMMKATRKLAASLRVDLKIKTGAIAFQVRMPNPVLAQQVVQRLLDELTRFNLEQRQSQAGAERRFTDGRIAQLEHELRDSEDRLQAFLQRNRDFQNSAELAFQRDRMAREVAFRQSVYTSVAQSNEKARIDEVRDTPVITVVERPSLPAEADGRGRTTSGLLAIIFGGLAAIVIGFVRDALERRRAAADPDFEALSTIAKETRDDLGRILRRVRWPFPRRGGTPS
jgi:uncharacterized protein involved in exopolysaccharide biosynthesis